MLKLMIVDDEPVIRNGLRHMILKEYDRQAEIVGASDGIEAVELLDTFHPDLLITDIQMPEMDGLQLIREAQKKKVKRFVILSGYDEFEYARQAIRLHVSDYLLKPIRQQDLSTLLNKVAAEVAAEGERPAETPQTSVDKFRAFVQKNYMRDVSLEEVAEHLDLHPNYVCSLLKREIGMTFVRYLHQVRIERAKELLASRSAVPLEQVARQVGYENPRHFYKVFKQYVGQTPGSFRNEAQKQHLET